MFLPEIYQDDIKMFGLESKHESFLLGSKDPLIDTFQAFRGEEEDKELMSINASR